MTKKKPHPKATHEEVLEKRAQAAWEYRQWNRETVNEKAKIPMPQDRTQRGPARAFAASCQVQAELQRADQGTSQEPDPARETAWHEDSRDYASDAPSSQHQIDSSQLETSASPPPPLVAKVRAVSSASPTPTGVAHKTKLRTPVHPRLRIADSWTPRTLAEIAASLDDEEEDEEDEGWEADNEREGPVLKATAHREYVPQPGQQPYMRDGRRYWF
ncbi:hypothetical protein B0H13DRAFT_2301824 [Mycena leptocephala]|nr:hypothetical protein B0H13DRAFT_2301824 [Mycena leptocephala]